MQAISLFRFMSSMALGLALTACGGGSGSTSETDQATNPAANAGAAGSNAGGDSAAPAPAPAGADAIDKYLGTFVSSDCVQMTDVLNAATDAPLFEKTTITVESKLAANRAQVTYLHAFFTGDTCTGESASLKVSGSSNTLTIDGTADVSKGTADKVTFSEGNKLPGISGRTITINGVSYINGYTLPKDTKTLLLLAGQDLFAGSATAPADAQGYPSALAESASFKKQ